MANTSPSRTRRQPILFWREERGHYARRRVVCGDSGRVDRRRWVHCAAGVGLVGESLVRSGERRAWLRCVSGRCPSSKRGD